MPIYEYQCSACGQKIEFLQKINELPKTLCPNCKKETLKRCISLPSFQLKGTGWYETDFKSKKKSEETVLKTDSVSTVETKSQEKSTTKKEEKEKT